jgi:hypothetical protein
MARYSVIMRALSEFTTAELTKCEELSAGLLALPECLPDRLAVILDTFNSDMVMEREDRAKDEEAARARAQAALAAGYATGTARDEVTETAERPVGR